MFLRKSAHNYNSSALYRNGNQLIKLKATENYKRGKVEYKLQRESPGSIYKLEVCTFTLQNTADCIRVRCEVPSALILLAFNT